MGISTSILMIAIGSVLDFGISVRNAGVFDINRIGLILLVIGILGLIVSLFFWRSWGGFGGFGGYRRRTVTRSPAGVGAYPDRYDGRSESVIEESETY